MRAGWIHLILTDLAIFFATFNIFGRLEALHILLATHVTDEVLSPQHGFPLRAVVSGRRGWFWVKWLTRVEVLENPGDVAVGVLASPLEVLRQW